MSAHSRLSPSASHRWLKCIGSVYLSGFLPKQESNEAADIGTFVHSVAEVWVSKLLYKQSDQPKPISEILEKEFGLRDLVNHMIIDSQLKDQLEADQIEESVALYADIIQTYLANMSDNYEALIEYKVPIHKGISGTADLILFDENTIHVIDYKNGRVPVSAVRNSQLMLYLYGFYLENKHRFNSLDNLTLKLTIVQPNSNNGQTVSTYELGLNDLFNLQLELKKAIHLLDVLDHTPLNDFDPDKSISFEGRNKAVLEAGSWCKYCPAMRVCPKLHKNFKVLLQNNMFKLNWVPSPEQLAEVLDFKPIFKEWADEIDKIVILRNELGEPLPPGYGVKERYGNRKIKNEVELLKTLREKYPTISKSIFEPAKLKSPSKLEKLIGKDIKPILKEHCEKPLTGYKLTKLN